MPFTCINDNEEYLSLWYIYHLIQTKSHQHLQSNVLTVQLSWIQKLYCQIEAMDYKPKLWQVTESKKFINQSSLFRSLSLRGEVESGWNFQDFRLLLQCRWGLHSSELLQEYVGNCLPAFWNSLPCPSLRVKMACSSEMDRDAFLKLWQTTTNIHCITNQTSKDLTWMKLV